MLPKQRQRLLTTQTRRNRKSPNTAAGDGLIVVLNGFANDVDWGDLWFGLNFPRN